MQAPLAGEIIAYLAEEGDPVEYRQELVEIAPYFGAHLFRACWCLACHGTS